MPIVKVYEDCVQTIDTLSDDHDAVQVRRHPPDSVHHYFIENPFLGTDFRQQREVVTVTYDVETGKPKAVRMGY